jgi:hypothetical protein
MTLPIGKGYTLELVNYVVRAVTAEADRCVQAKVIHVGVRSGSPKPPLMSPESFTRNATTTCLTLASRSGRDAVDPLRHRIGLADSDRFREPRL